MSEHVFINPQYKPHHDLGASSKTDAEWDTLKAILVTFMQENEGKSTLTVTDARALDPAFANDPLWHQLAQDLGLVEIDIG